MWRLRRSTLLAGGLGLGLSLASCSPALAADPVLALTSAGQLVRFDADAPGAIPAPITPSGVDPGDKLIAIGHTGFLVQALGRSGQIYAIDLATGAAVPVAAAQAPATLAAGVGIVDGYMEDPQVVLPDGSLCVEHDDGCNPAADYQATGQPPDVVAAAVAPTTNPPGPVEVDSMLYVVDGASGGLDSRDPAYYEGYLEPIGSLGVPLAGPTALAVSAGATRGFLVTGAPTQTEYAVNLSTGAATPIGPLGGGATITGVTAIPPARITQDDPVSGAPLASAAASPVDIVSLPDPAVEGRDKQLVIPVNRSGDPTGPASVDYATFVSGPYAAVPGVDYVPVSGTVHFAPGQEYGSFTVPLLDGPADPDPPGYTTLGLALANPVGAIGIGWAIAPSSVGGMLLDQPGHPPDPPSATGSPLLTGTSAGQSIASVVAHGIAISVTCGAACTVTVTANAAVPIPATTRATADRAARVGSAHPGRLGSTTIHLARPGRHVFHLRLSAQGRRSLRAVRRAAVSLLGAARFASGARASGQLRLTLVRRGR